MIIELLFELIIGLINLLISIIPDISLTIDLPNTSWFSEMLGLADYFFPVTTLIMAIGVIIAVQNAQFFIKIFTFIIKRIPFIG